MMRPRYAQQDKYTLVAELLRGRSGTLLDMGARDRALLRYLDPSRISYTSSDFGPGHDYAFDLERPVSLPDRSFDFVAALDVLEHVEAIHSAFAELMRLARRGVFLSLPNLNSIRYRARFLLTGRINNKYLLLPEHQGDRHRWLTVYADIYQFITRNAERHSFRVVAAYNLIAFGGLLRPLRLLAHLAAAFNWMGDGLFTNTVVFALQRANSVDG